MTQSSDRLAGAAQLGRIYLAFVTLYQTDGQSLEYNIGIRPKVFLFSHKFCFSAPPDCESGKFSCGDYKFNSTYCIPPHFRCDKTFDCHDQSDESNCHYRQKHEGDHECSPIEGATESLWIPRDKVCDGYFDCRDHSDEEDSSCDKSKVSCEVSPDLYLKSFEVSLNVAKS